MFKKISNAFIIFFKKMRQLINTLETIKYNKNIITFCVFSVFFFFPKAVDITSCGNFAVIGLSSGAVDV